MILSKSGLAAAMENVRDNPHVIATQAPHVAEVISMNPALGPYLKKTGDGVSVYAAWIFQDDWSRMHGLVVRLNADDDLAITLASELSPPVEVEIGGVQWFIEAVHEPEQLAFIASLPLA